MRFAPYGRLWHDSPLKISAIQASQISVLMKPLDWCRVMMRLRYNPSAAMHATSVIRFPAIPVA
jgi:hypothetical protein